MEKNQEEGEWRIWDSFVSLMRDVHGFYASDRNGVNFVELGVFSACAVIMFIIMSSKKNLAETNEEINRYAKAFSFYIFKEVRENLSVDVNYLAEIDDLIRARSTVYLQNIFDFLKTANAEAGLMLLTDMQAFISPPKVPSLDGNMFEIPSRLAALSELLVDSATEFNRSSEAGS